MDVYCKTSDDLSSLYTESLRHITCKTAIEEAERKERNIDFNLTGVIFSTNC
jgi:hypothetical protein